MKISIALATYNGARYIQDQLDSYITQERLPDELVVCDDASSDNTVGILKKFKEAAPFDVNLTVNTTNIGFTHNFEKSLSACSGDIIFLSDQDDVWSNNKICTVIEAFEKNPESHLVAHDGELVNAKLKSTGLTKLGQILDGYGYSEALVTGSLTALSREFSLLALPIPSSLIGHDVWLHKLAILLGVRQVIDQNLQLIRRHTHNTSGWIASSLKPIGQLSVALSQFQTVPSSSYEDRLVMNIELKNRLLLLKSSIHATIDLSNISSSLDSLSSENDAIHQRQILITLGFFARRLAALKMLVRGDYHYFNGIKSFLRDICR